MFFRNLTIFFHFLIVDLIVSLPVVINQTSTTSTTTKSPIELMNAMNPARFDIRRQMKIERKLPFLIGLNETNRNEFFRIIQNEKLSKAEIWKNVEEWAKNQPENIQIEIVDFHQKLAHHVDNSKLRVSKIIQNLPKALKSLSAIVQNVEITRLQEQNRIANLYSALDDDVAKTLQFIINMVSYENNEGKKIEEKYQLRKLKKGGIWKGNLQPTNII